MLALGGICCFLALLLDDRILAAATLALWLAPLASLAMAVLQRRMLTVPLAREAMASGRAPGNGWRRFLLPGNVTVTPQWERLDQHGTVILQGAGPIPQERGLYRHLALAASWADPFGLIFQRRMLPDDGETLMLPAQGDERDRAGLASDSRMQDQSAGDMASSVRQYAPGDSPRLISWRHTAHRGELMTRESDRDVQVMTLLVVDTGSGLADEPETDLDAAAAFALAQLRDVRGGGAAVAVSDGRTVHAGKAAAVRFLAAMRPERLPAGQSRTQIVKPDDASKPDDAAKPGDSVKTDSAQATATQPSSVPSERRAALVAAFVAAQHQPMRILLVTADRRSPLAAAFAASPLDGKVTVHAVGVAAPDSRGAASDAQAPMPCVSASASTSETGAQTGSAGSAGAAPSAVDDRRRRARQGLLGRAVAAASLIVLHAVTLGSLGGLVELKGLWVPFAGVGLLAVTLEAVVLPPRTAWRSARRVVVSAAIIAVAALALIVLRIQGITGQWVFARSVVENAESGPVAVWNFRLLPGMLSEGAWNLYIQLPPLTVSAASDLFLVAVAAAVLVLLRCLLAVPYASAAVPLIAVTVMAVGFAFVGQVPSYLMIGVTVFASVLLLWAVHPMRAPAPVPVVASALVTALTLALTPSATSFAIGVPLAVGTPGGLFSTSTVNPLVDLKRGLAQGSNNVVLHYSTYDGSPYYFRLATLDDFNGDTWRYDPQLASEGGLYGGRPNFGASPQSDPLGVRGWSDGEADYIRSLSPLMRTLVAVNNGTYAGTFSASDIALANRFVAQSDVTIDSLASRFLPVIGDARNISGLSDEEQRSWYQADDGTVFSPEALTGQGLTYAVSGTYLTPIGSKAQFAQIESVDRLRKAYLDRLNGVSTSSNRPSVSSPEERAALRRSLAANHYGRVDGDYLIVNVHVKSIAGAVAGLLVDADGTAVDDDPHSIASLRSGNLAMQLGEEFRSKLAVNPGESFAVIPGGVPDESGEKAELSLIVRLDGRTAREGSSRWEDFQAMASGYASAVNASGLAISTVTVGSERRQNQDRGPTITAQQLNDDGSGLARRARYGGLPAELPEHVQAVVDEAKAAGVPSDGANETNQVAAMRWLVDYLTGPEFTYSLNQPDGNGRSNLDVIDDFLVSRSGYCTHYASALAVLGRAMGLSTRIVLGYNASGAASEDGSRTTYEVQARQLHSWTEVYIDNIGWVPFDVTPAAGGGNAPASSQDDATDTTMPSASASSSSVSASASVSANESTSDEETDPTTSDDPSSSVSDATDATVSAAGPQLPGWAVRVLWTFFGLVASAALLLAPGGIRERRRRRRLRLIDQAIAVGDDGTLNRNAWRAAWGELLDCARDTGLRWPATVTDGEIADMLCERFPEETTGIRTIAEQVATVAYGSPDAAVEPPDAAVTGTLNAMRAHASRFRRLAPRSLVR